MIKVLVFISLTFGLIACQQFTKSHCEKTNWRKEAFLLALAGESRNSFNKISKQCKKFKVDIDAQVFNEGFDEGAIQFCNTKSGITYGQQGGTYRGTCKNFNETEYIKSYINGRLSFLNNQYNLKKISLEESEARLWRKRNEFELESNTNPNLAVKTHDELESLKAENELIKTELENLKKMISDLQKESVKEIPTAL